MSEEVKPAALEVEPKPSPKRDARVALMKQEQVAREADLLELRTLIQKIDHDNPDPVLTYQALYLSLKLQGFV